jgi:hypothetical protein
MVLATQVISISPSSNPEKDLKSDNKVSETKSENLMKSNLKDRTQETLTTETKGTPKSLPQNNYNQNNDGHTQQKSYVYYTKKSQSHHEPSPWESIVAILMVICICYLCFQCCTAHTDVPVNKGDQNNMQNGDHVSPDGFIYYCN